MSDPVGLLVRLVESEYIPDAVIRAGIRSLNRKRLRLERRGGGEALSEHRRHFIEMLRHSPIAVMTDAANRQHYEVPAEFFLLVLGRRLKYSCCLYPKGTETLDEAEEEMLRLTCERAQTGDGMDILELGCGWGSLTLWMAERYPRSKVTAVSNSTLQREFIEGRCKERGMANVSVITADMNYFETDRHFDRIVSIEMFEHMRNYEKLLGKVASWLKPEGKLFVHIFSHREYAYLFEMEGEDDWMGRHFFSGGIMPSDDLLLHFRDDVVVEAHWQVAGTHYEKTAEHWLANIDARRSALMPVLEKTYGKSDASLWLRRWRIFFMACAELFGFRDGREWGVSHYLFRKRGY
ncbi:MAG TPA: cyclopropane-fatty-acyl-phospholipid synthase family protein [Dissulfurispiraceae bacterium]|nr:cyclopropane-fatty-acyl-phospholipid synthase family protein [Dissulfurispiraceae bacterium]